jgi:hypothetical protein
LRVHGARAVAVYTAANVDRVRRLTGRPGLPVHPIAGLADGLNRAEASAAVGAARSTDSLGVSFYNVGRSGTEDWSALGTF